MHISRNSWHYKMVAKRSRWGEVPGNLCPYMRRLFWGIACLLTKAAGYTVLGIIAIAVAVAPMMGIVHWYIIEFLPTNWLRFEEDYMHPFAFALGVGLICYMVVAAMIAFLAGKEGYDRYRYSDWRSKRLTAKAVAEDAAQEHPPKPPSVFVEWIKSLHNKTCSSLEFIDDPA